MIIVDKMNTLWDISRLVWTISTYLVFLILGFLVCYYYYDKKPVSCSCNYNVTCSSDSLPPVIIRCDQPKTWV